MDNPKVTKPTPDPTVATNDAVMRAVPKRFWLKVNMTDSCWLWEGSKSSNGYGQIMISRRLWATHRLVYSITKGTIPKGLQLDHLCKVRHCVNPHHLEAVTARENVLRGNAPSAVNAKKSHCLRGHPFCGTHFRVDSTGRRICRVCKRGRQRLSRGFQGTRNGPKAVIYV